MKNFNSRPIRFLRFFEIFGGRSREIVIIRCGGRFAGSDLACPSSGRIGVGGRVPRAMSRWFNAITAAPSCREARFRGLLGGSRSLAVILRGS